MALLAGFSCSSFAGWIEPETAKKTIPPASSSWLPRLAGDGVRVVLPTDGDRLYARPGRGQRPDHAGCLRAHRDVSLRRGPCDCPFKVLNTSVVVFIVIPLAAGWLTATAC